MDAREPYLDKTPDGIFIKLFPAKLRALAREHRLRRAEIGELVLLACRIDSEGFCFPSKNDSAKSIGMRSGQGARNLQKRLRDKGVLSWDFEHDSRSPRFRLPDAFYFGADSYRNNNSASRELHNDQSRELHNSETRRIYNSKAQQDPPEGKPNRTKTTSQQTGPDSFKKVGAIELPLLRKDQRPTLLSLSEAGVSDLEAYLITIQYRPATIDKAIADSTGPNIRNRGAWIRRAIEMVAAEPLNYPALPKGQMRAAAAMAVVAASANRYLNDPYFDNAQPGEYNANGDTADNGSADYSPDQGETTDYRQAQTYNMDGDPTDSHLPF